VNGTVLQNGDKAYGNFKVKGASESGSLLMYQP
jgi:hypothetical protein